MTIIYVTENNCKCDGVTFQNKGWVRVQKLEDVSEDKNIIYKVSPLKIFLGKSQLCDMTEFSGAKNKEVFEGNTILLKIGEENNKHRYVFIGGDMICTYLTNVNFLNTSRIWVITSHHVVLQQEGNIYIT